MEGANDRGSNCKQEVNFRLAHSQNISTINLIPKPIDLFLMENRAVGARQAGGDQLESSPESLLPPI